MGYHIPKSSGVAGAADPTINYRQGATTMLTPETKIAIRDNDAALDTTAHALIQEHFGDNEDIMTIVNTGWANSYLRFFMTFCATGKQPKFQEALQAAREVWMDTNHDLMKSVNPNHGWCQVNTDILHEVYNHFDAMPTWVRAERGLSFTD